MAPPHSVERITNKRMVNGLAHSSNASFEMHQMRTDAKLKRGTIKGHSQTGREFLNRSAMGGIVSSQDGNPLQIGRSPDRSKNHTNLSVYS